MPSCSIRVPPADGFIVTRRLPEDRSIIPPNVGQARFRAAEPDGQQTAFLRRPEELLEHQLCSQSSVTMIDASGTPRVKYIRGLRVKTGISVGPAKANPHGTTGRMAYRGKVINRAARVSKIAVAGQVLVSASVWEQAKDSAIIKQRRVMAVNLGHRILKVKVTPFTIFFYYLL
ncbi:unnamed protein product [Ostreobium quekettii]|uniref:Guanylate cyclase domain-containing protein n=1 Tax=Ostreobium quekettii TaxID=121088 RepID=A0A8S1IX72_9CHLO|nr:unnamed protein product [Ostreobium quekettii]